MSAILEYKIDRPETWGLLDLLEENRPVALVDESSHRLPANFLRDPEQEVPFVQELQVVPQRLRHDSISLQRTKALFPG